MVLPGVETTHPHVILAPAQGIPTPSIHPPHSQQTSLMAPLHPEPGDQVGYLRSCVRPGTRDGFIHLILGPDKHINISDYLRCDLLGERTDREVATQGRDDATPGREVATSVVTTERKPIDQSLLQQSNKRSVIISQNKQVIRAKLGN